MTKRNLTKIEIESILDFIKPNIRIPTETAAFITENAKAPLREQLLKVKIYPKMIPKLKEKVKKIFINSLVQPGESVGIITAQSIGEKQTQSNLNSVDWKEKILYRKKDKIFIEKIGKFIDRLLSNEKAEFFPESRTYYLSLKEGYFIPSSDENGNVDWYKIEAVTKHLPVDGMIKITTESGRNTTVTKGKSLICLKNWKFTEINGSELKIGDIIPTTKTLKKPFETKLFDDNDLDREFGFITGSFIHSGLMSDKYIYINCKVDKIRKLIQKYSLQYMVLNEVLCLEICTFIHFLLDKTAKSQKKKTIPNFCFTASKSFLIGLLDYFQEHMDNLENIDLCNGLSVLLSYFGLFSKIVKIDNIFRLDIIDKNSLKEILTNNIEKSIKQDDENCLQDVYLDKVTNIQEICSSTEYVYDLTVEKTRNFSLFNGITVRDTFHKAGSSEKQPVVSKFSELLNATNKPKAPSYTIYFNGKNDTIDSLREKIGNELVEIYIKRLTKKSEICIDKKPEKWYKLYDSLYDKKPDLYKHCISVNVDLDILFEFKITLQNIKQSLEKQFNDCFCVFSPDCFGIIDIYFDTSNIDLPEEKLVFITKENAVEIYLEEVVQPILESTVISGTSGINNIFFLQENKEWIVQTENVVNKNKITNKKVNKKSIDSVKKYKQVLAKPFVDSKRTLSNNIWDIYHTLGIEAVRQYMINEFSQIMEGINVCHVMLLVDKMTFTGSISSISRYTMRSEECGPFGKASFEETLDNFLKAGVYGQDEPIKGVSASIICGKKPPIGTGFCDLTVDLDKLL